MPVKVKPKLMDDTQDQWEKEMHLVFMPEME